MSDAAIVIDHNGGILSCAVEALGATYVGSEDVSEPWVCKLDHEHSSFCGIDRSFVVCRYFEREEYRCATSQATFTVYRERIKPFTTLHPQQLQRRYEETESEWLRIGQKLDRLKAEIDRRAREATP